MAGFAARIRAEAHYLVFLQVNGVGRIQIVRYQQRRLFDGGQESALVPFQVADEPLAYVKNIVAAFFKKRVFYFFKLGGEFLQRKQNGRLRA